ncbi:MAG: hypothetical protein V9H25_16955 [Candidatus Competibacter sp.]
MAALRVGQTNGIHRIARIGDVNRREHVARSGVRVQRTEPGRWRLIASVAKVLRDGAQLAPRAEQVNLDLAGDGAGQSLMADFEVRAQLRQQHPQDEGGHHRQRHQSGQRDSRRQPQSKRASGEHGFTRPSRIGRRGRP